LKITTPTPHVGQFSAKDEQNRAMLSVLAKRTYLIDGAGCVVAPEQLPMLPMRIDPDEPEVLFDDTDIWPMKQLTDVVVKGHAYAHGGGREIVASIAVRDLVKEIAVVGDRRASLADGRVVFSEPARFERMPLDARHAYGGHDRAAERVHGNPFEAVRRHLSPPYSKSTYSPFRYPRNGVGKGYVVERTLEAIDGAELPNLEDPTDRLTPERFVVGGTGAWPKMPLPWTTAWQSFGAFPRYGYCGACAPFDPLPGEIEEVRRGFMPKGYPRKGPPVDPRVYNGGSLGLQLPQVVAGATGGLVFKLKNMHPTKREMSFSLPAAAPTIKVDGREGKLLTTDPVVHHVVIEPDLDRVTVVWRGAARAKRPYLPDELREMPLEVTWS
jgi:hypothetical protein